MSYKNVKEFENFANAMIRHVSNIERAMEFFISEHEERKGWDTPQMLDYFDGFLQQLYKHGNYMFNIRMKELSVPPNQISSMAKKTEELHNRVTGFVERHKKKAQELYDEHTKLMEDQQYVADSKAKVFETTKKWFVKNNIPNYEEFDDAINKYADEFTYIDPSQEMLDFYYRHFCEALVQTRHVKQILENPSKMTDEDKDFMEEVSIQIPLAELLKMDCK